MKEDGNLCILIVEDDPAIQSLVSLGLRYEHYHVIATDNGLTGLQLFEEHKPDLIILDWLLPGMDGIKVVPPDSLPVRCSNYHDHRTRRNP